MISAVKDYPVSTILDQDEKIVYIVPPYQREYTWKKHQWEALFNDLLENKPGYYLGTIICINQTRDTSAPKQELDLIDGQQRMTTLSLLYASIYQVLRHRRDELTDDQQEELPGLRTRLALKKDKTQPRLAPQLQTHNQEDYFSVLRDELGLPVEGDKPKNAGNRRIYRAYKYFLDRVEWQAANESRSIADIFGLMELVNAAIIVKIEVLTHSDAYILFESLNNRGVPLTAVDIIKNKLLSIISKRGEAIQPYYNRWKRLVKHLGDDYAVQDRFFRHFYNAFRGHYTELKLPQLATRTTLIPIYEGLLDFDVHIVFDELQAAAQVYGKIIGETEEDPASRLEQQLRSLNRIQGVPSYMLLLYLMRQRERLGIDDGALVDIVALLVSFFVRRNLTERPPTYELGRLFMRTIDRIDQPGGGVDIYATLLDELLKVSASDADFRVALRGRVYLASSMVTKFMLASLCERAYTKEVHLDLWELRKSKAIWTVEHVLPQGDNIPVAWVDMIASGDRERAEEIKERYVHTLGNLTLSGYNSDLGNKSFAEKQRRLDKQQQRPIGYNNGLSINRELFSATAWTVSQIEARTEQLADEIFSLFPLE